jgi:hypothetical protein
MLSVGMNTILSLPGLTRQSMMRFGVGILTIEYHALHLIMDARVKPGHDG